MKIREGRLESLRSLVRLLPAVALLLVSGCSRTAEPVAELTAEPTELRLPFPEFELLNVTLEPLSDLPPGIEPQLFLHLLDEPGSVIRTFDLPIPGAWQVGHRIELQVRLSQSALADPLEPGSYLLTAGLYDPQADRFPLRTSAKKVSRLEYQVATVAVPAPGMSLPTVRFSDGWLAAEPGYDRQVLVRRSLVGAGPATLQIGPLRGPGQLLLRLAPAPGVLPERIEIQAGADSPRVRLRSSCGGFEAEISGDPGVETLIDVPATAEEVSCDIEVAPNFTARVGVDGQARSSAIEVLAWRAGSELE